MHTTVIETENGTFRAHHNGDFSGDVLLYLPEGQTVDTSFVEGVHAVHVPFEVMERLVDDKRAQEAEK